MADETLERFIEDVCGDSRLRVEADLGDGFVRLRSAEAERRQAAEFLPGKTPRSVTRGGTGSKFGPGVLTDRFSQLSQFGWQIEVQVGTSFLRRSDRRSL